MNNQKFTKNLIAIEIELGFVRIPNRYKDLFPIEKSKIKVYLGNAQTGSEVGYNPKYQRIFGLVRFFRFTKTEPRDILEIEKINDKKFRLKLKKLKPQEKEQLEFTQEEAKEIIDLSNLSAKVKGNIIEDRIKDLIMLHGQGLLNVYQPAADIEGIDLIVVKKGVYQPLFLQIKGRYNLRGQNNLQIGIRKKSFNPHHTLFVVGAYFNPKKMDIDDYLVFVPSEKFTKKANVIRKNTDKALYVLNTPLLPGRNTKFSEFIIKKENLVNKIFEKFNEIAKYLK